MSMECVKGTRLMAFGTVLIAIAGTAAATDLAQFSGVTVSNVEGISLSESGAAFYADDFTDAARWRSPEVHGASLSVKPCFPCGFGRCLEVTGVKTAKVDSAWCIETKRFPFSAVGRRFVFRADVYGTMDFPSITSFGARWGSAIHWYGADGDELGVSRLVYPLAKDKWSEAVCFGDIPDGSQSFSLRLGFDGPNLIAGEAVRYRNIEIGTVGDVREFVREGEIVSYPRRAGAVSWEAETPEGTSIGVQVALAGTPADLHGAKFIGPDGTDATWYSSPFVPRDGYLRYRVRLSGNGANTPTLKSVTVGGKKDAGFLPRPDRLPPTVCIENATAPVQDRLFRPVLSVTDDSTVDWRSLDIELDGRKATDLFVRTGDRLTMKDVEAPWTPGLHRLDVTARDWNGNSHVARKRFYVGEEPVGVPRYTLRDDGVMLVDGRPFFPIGIYGLKKCAANGGSYDRAMRSLKDAGFNMVQSYQRAEREEFLAAATTNGMLSFVGVHMPDEPTFKKFRPYGGIAAWYLGDDTSEHCSAMELRDRMDGMRAADGTRLTCQADNYGYASPVANYFDYAAGTDIFLPELYPIRNGDARDVKSAVAMVVTSMRRIRADVAANGLSARGVWALMQHFSGWTNWKRFPTRDELFATSFAALANGATGIMWYTYSGGRNKDGKTYNYGAADLPERWVELTELSRRIAELSPILLERTPPDQPAVRVLHGPTYDILKNPSVTVLLKRHEGNTYLLAVNGTTETVRVEISFAGGTSAGDVMWEGRRICRDGNSLTDDFLPFAVHVYRF